VAQDGIFLMALIVSTLPGRIRVRHGILASTDCSKRLRHALLAHAGVKEVIARPDARSLIVHYDAKAIVPEIMEDFVDTAVAAEIAARKAAQTRSARLNHYSKYGMLLTLALTLAFAAGRKRRAHTLTGVFFLVALGAHLFHPRQRITD
jgi:hypothetical protein